jgi:hypothetical protein
MKDRMNRVVTPPHALAEARIAQLEAEVAWLRRTDSLADVAPLLFGELRNLFAPVSIAVQLLAASLEGELATIAKSAAEASDLATRLVRHALDYVHQAAPNAQQLDPGGLVSELRPLIETLLSGRALAIERHDPPGTMVDVDRIALERVLLNLACYARETSDELSTVAIVTSVVTLVPEQARAHGCPRPGEHLALRFHRAGATDSATDLDGNLALRMVNALALERGWGFSFRSEPGGSTTTCVFLPRPDLKPVSPGKEQPR